MASVDAFAGNIPQALLLWNGEVTNQGARARRGSMLATILASTPEPTQRLRRMFLATYSRPPTADGGGALPPRADDAGGLRGPVLRAAHVHRDVDQPLTWPTASRRLTRRNLLRAAAWAGVSRPVRRRAAGVVVADPAAAVAVADAARPRPRARLHPALHGRRAEPARHVRSQAGRADRRAVQGDRDAASRASASPSTCRCWRGRRRRLAIIRSLTSKEGNHDRARHLMHTGLPAAGRRRPPAFGALVAEARGPARAPRLRRDRRPGQRRRLPERGVFAAAGAEPA